jgi:Uma2 family endonuclease
MTSTLDFPPIIIDYPEEDGLPMAESDQTREYLVYATKVLNLFFQERPDVYTSGNLFIYYEEGNPKAVVAPDTFVIFGAENRQRKTYKVWEENNRVPNFVLELTSKTTRSQDQGAKKGIYAYLGVQEYYQYDPTGDYLDPQLQGLRLVGGNYSPVETSTLPNGTLVLPSQVLGLELHLTQKEMRFYNPEMQQYLLSHEEEASARQTAETRAQTAETRAQTAEERAERLAAKLRELNIDPEA